MADSRIVQAIQSRIGPCREWLNDKHNICGEPSEYVLWGKLIPPDGLGPRCYDHAAQHVGHNALRPGTLYALIRVEDLAADLERTESFSESSP